MKTHILKYYLLCISAFYFAHPVYAQEFPQLYFENITTSNGLSDNMITCIYEDRNGFLWIGTANGLNKYDGLLFQTFYSIEGNKNSLSGNVIVDILEDSEGIFWIATRDGGLTRYDPSATKDKQFLQFRNDPAETTSIVSNRVIAVEELNKDYILFSSENASVGFIHKNTFEISYSCKADTTKSIIDPKGGIPKPDSFTWVHHFNVQGENMYISKLSPGAVYVFNKNGELPKKQNFKTAPASIQHFEVDGDSIWLATWAKGLYVQPNPLYVKPGVEVTTQKVMETESEVTYVLSFDEDILLVGTRQSGLYLTDKHRFSSIQYKHKRDDNFSIASNRITCIYKSKNGILWIGTSAGLSKYNPMQWQFKRYQISNDFEKDINHFSTFAYNPEKLGICTSNGIYAFSIPDKQCKLITFQYRNNTLRTTSAKKLNAEQYYLNTESSTFIYTPKNENIQLFNPEYFYSSATGEKYKLDAYLKRYQTYDVLFDTIEDNPLHLFRTIGSGIGVYDVKNSVYRDFYKVNEPNALSNNFVRVVYRDSEKNIWVGTSEGLNKWNKSIELKHDFEIFLHLGNDSNTISNNSVSGIFEDEYKHLWITTGNGINEYDGNKFTYYSPDKSQSFPMYGLYVDENKNFWSAVRGGFEVFDPRNKKFRFVPLLNSDWLLKNPVQLFQMEGGDWFYGAGNYLIQFDPESYRFETSFPQIYLSEFSIFDDPIFNTTAFNDLTFSHKENFITIRFSCLQLSQPSTVKYQYHLEGLNNEWIETGNSGEIRFTSLPPGKYKLLLKVTNPQGDWSPENLLVEFVIKHPYWQQWWFYLLCILSGISLIYIIIKYRENQFLKLQNVRNNIANDLHDDVGSALSTINLYSEVAKMKSNTENEDLKNMLNKISDTSIEMQDNMNHIVWSLQPRNDNFEQMTLRMKSFAIENLLIKNIKTDFIVDEKLTGIKLTPDKRHEFFLIFKEAINNIVKYANCSEVKIHLYRNKNKVVMEIADNGVGFDMNTNYSGNGLHSMQDRSRKLKGKFKIISEIGKGTKINLIFEI